MRHTTAMADTLLDRVAEHIAARGLLPAGASVLALVSGGADSMCLLHVLTRLHDGPIGVLTFDHGLRARSADEAVGVAAAAAALGCRAWVKRLDVAPGPGVQARARDARREATAQVAGRHGFDVVATGHTATDQAETVLFRLARGTGRDGAVGMSAAGPVIRPLLVITRAEARDWCRREGVAFVDDPSNDDPTYARSRVRHDLLAGLRAVHPGAEVAIARHAELLDDEAAVLRPLVAAAWDRCGHDGGLDVAALAAEDQAMRRLVVRRLLAAAGVPADRVWVERALALATSGGGLDVPGARVYVWRGVLFADPAAPPPRAAQLDVPGCAVFGRHRLHAFASTAATPTPDRVDVRITGPLEVRSPQPGDRIALAGGGHQTVGRLLAAAGVASHRRSAVPVVVAGRQLVWVSGYRADVTLLARPGEPATRLELR